MRSELHELERYVHDALGVAVKTKWSGADQRTYIYANEAKMTPDEKRTEIENLPQLVTTEQQDDATLAQTQTALKALAATNDALMTTKNSKQAPAFRALLAELVAEGQQIGSVYRSTMSQ